MTEEKQEDNYKKEQRWRKAEKARAQAVADSANLPDALKSEMHPKKGKYHLKK